MKIIDPFATEKKNPFNTGPSATAYSYNYGKKNQSPYKQLTRWLSKSAGKPGEVIGEFLNDLGNELGYQYRYTTQYRLKEIDLSPSKKTMRQGLIAGAIVMGGWMAGKLVKNHNANNVSYSYNKAPGKQYTHAESILGDNTLTDPQKYEKMLADVPDFAKDNYKQSWDSLRTHMQVYPSNKTPATAAKGFYSSLIGGTVVWPWQNTKVVSGFYTMRDHGEHHSFDLVNGDLDWGTMGSSQLGLTVPAFMDGKIKYWKENKKHTTGFMDIEKENNGHKIKVRYVHIDLPDEVPSDFGVTQGSDVTAGQPVTRVHGERTPGEIPYEHLHLQIFVDGVNRSKDIALLYKQYREANIDNPIFPNKVMSSYAGLLKDDPTGEKFATNFARLQQANAEQLGYKKTPLTHQYPAQEYAKTKVGRKFKAYDKIETERKQIGYKIFLKEMLGKDVQAQVATEKTKAKKTDLAWNDAQNDYNSKLQNYSESKRDIAGTQAFSTEFVAKRRLAALSAFL